MAGDEEILKRIVEGRHAIAFRDFERVLRKLGFEEARIRGSHQIYRHPKVPRPLSIQRFGKEAKPYQIRQLRDMTEEFGLELEA